MTAMPTSHSQGDKAVTIRPPSRKPTGARLNRFKKKPEYATHELKFVGYISGKRESRRLVGDYLAVVTMGLGEIARAVFKNWIAVTRGPMGLPGIPHASLFGLVEFDSAEKFLVLGLVCLALGPGRLVAGEIAEAFLQLALGLVELAFDLVVSTTHVQKPLSVSATAIICADRPYCQ